MRSSVESLSTEAQPEDGVKLESILHNSSHKRSNTKDVKLTGCELLKKKCLGEDVKPSAGMCMIAFAIPLLIPGITLTAVAFDDETGFAKYSALHILGIVMLGLAVLLIIIGALLNISFKSRVGPDQSLHTVSTHERLQNDKIFVTNVEDDAQKYPEISAPPSRSHGVNFMADSGHNTALDGDHHVQFATTTVGASSFTDGHSRPAKRIFTFSSSDTERYSSSFESSDSEDFSSGSYIVSEEIVDVKQSEENISLERDNSETKEPNSAPDITVSGLRGIRKYSGRKGKLVLVRQIAHSKSDTNVPSAEVKKSVNFFQDPEDQNSGLTLQPSSAIYGNRTSENVRNSYQDSIQNGKESHQRSNDKLSPRPAHVTFDTSYQPPSGSGRVKVGYSPATRQRLQALSSEMQAVISDTHRSELSSNNSSSEKISSGSNSSVFSLDKGISTDVIAMEQKGKPTDDCHSDSELEIGHRYATTQGFQTLPKNIVIASSIGRVSQDESHFEAHTARSQSWHNKRSDPPNHQLSLDLRQLQDHTSHDQTNTDEHGSPFFLPKQSSTQDEDYDSEPKPLPKAKFHLRNHH